MKKLIFILLPVMIYAQSFMLSNIPLPKTYIQNLDPYDCNEECMQAFLDNGMIFSFLAHADSKLNNAEQNEVRAMAISILNLGSFYAGDKLQIAMLLPYKKIGKYASSTTNAAFAYLMTKTHPFSLKSYKVESEEIEELQAVLAKIEADGFGYVIAPVTLEGAQNIISISPSLNVYFPTINKKDVSTSSDLLYFGAIDYAAQSDILLKESVSPLVIFSDNSLTGNKLATYQEATFLENYVPEENPEDETIKKPKVIKNFISKKTTNLESYLKEKEEILNASFFINTPIVKSGMVMSQITLYDANATNLLSTQVNYDPLLLSMTQYIDRKDMIVANSITQNSNMLIETNSLLGNDIVYDWINYATTLGIDYFYSVITAEERTYTTGIVDHQVLYDIELLKPGRSKFGQHVSLAKKGE